MCGEMRVLFVLGQPSAEIVRVGWANMWCGEMRNFFARSNRLRRSCVSNIFERPNMWWNVNLFWARATLCRDRAGRASKHVAKCKFGGARRSPFARNEGQPSKTCLCKIVILIPVGIPLLTWTPAFFRQKTAVHLALLKWHI